MIHEIDKSTNNTTLAEEAFVNQMERTLENIIGYKVNNKELLTKDILTIIEYDGVSSMINSNNLIFTEKQKSVVIYCILRNPDIKQLDFSQITANNVIKRFNIFIMHKENKIPDIYGTDGIKINIINYSDLSY